MASKRFPIGRGLAGCVVVLLVMIGSVTLVTSYTATTAVPASHLGASVQPRLVSQLAPAGCTSLNVSMLVQGAGVFSNSLSHALILASPGSDTITDSGANNCIIGGAGTDSVYGPSSDICISGPTNNLATSCAIQSNVTVTHTADTYGNYGGRRTLTLNNNSPITALTITIKIAQTTGATFSSQANGFPAGAMTDTHTTAGGFITYSYVLKQGHTIPAHYSGGTVDAEFDGTGTAHPTSADTWTVATTSGGVTATQNGGF